MIDEATRELLSRYLDGDLEPGEGRLLEARLEGEPSLAAELAGLGLLRDSLRELAAREDPPSSLDAALEPLRRSAPPAPVLRPAYRWVALAATLLIGATVTLRVAQRASTSIAPPLAPSSRLGEARDTPYQLRPLPTSSVPEDKELLGAADHLLASPPPTPVLPEPALHTAVGPLSERERQLTAPAETDSTAERRELVRVKTKAPAQADEQAATGLSATGRERAATDEASKMEAPRELSAASASRRSDPAVAGGLEGRSQAPAPRLVTLTLSTESGPVVIRHTTRIVDDIPDGRVWVSVRGGVIVAVRSPATNEAPPLPDNLVRELTGLAAGDVAEGDFAAAIRVH